MLFFHNFILVSGTRAGLWEVISGSEECSDDSYRYWPGCQESSQHFIILQTVQPRDGAGPSKNMGMGRQLLE
jgi:hypothetical protein